jgi:hypothetical protein
MLLVYWLASHAYLASNAAFAQNRPGAASFADSSAFSAADSSLLEWNAGSEYEVLRLRVQRWLTKNQEKASLVFTNVAESLQEAEGLARAQDYVTAQLLLETALELIETASSAASALNTMDDDRSSHDRVLSGKTLGVAIATRI